MKNSWKKEKFGNVITLHRGYDLPVEKIEKGSHPVLFSNGEIEYHIRYKIKGPGVVTGRSGALGNVFYIDEDYWPHNTTLYVSDFHGNDPKFVYYFLKRFNFSNFNSGTGVPTLNRNFVHQAEIAFPEDVSDQKRIADILSAFDDKIKLNNKISVVLEQMAQAIFKEWFVKFKFPGHKKIKMVDSELGKIPAEWRVEKLGDVADVQWGDTSVTKSSYVREGYITYSASGQDGFRTKYDFDRVGIVLSAIGANCGITWLARNKWSVIKNTIRFWSIDDKVSTEYLYLATRGQTTWPQRGSAQPFIALDDARKRKILIPAENILKQFNDFITVVYSKIDIMRLENQRLAAMRDLLLPKLMNGAIRV